MTTRQMADARWNNATAEQREEARAAVLAYMQRFVGRVWFRSQDIWQALKMAPWLNTAADEQRLAAALIVIKARKA